MDDWTWMDRLMFSPKAPRRWAIGAVVAAVLAVAAIGGPVIWHVEINGCHPYGHPTGLVPTCSDR